eukprot:4126148-Pleurochrysis_carterae.AAC.1
MQHDSLESRYISSSIPRLMTNGIPNLAFVLSIGPQAPIPLFSLQRLSKMLGAPSLGVYAHRLCSRGFLAHTLNRYTFSSITLHSQAVTCCSGSKSLRKVFFRSRSPVEPCSIPGC